MKKLTNHKLHLSNESLRQLTGTELRAVAGGELSYVCPKPGPSVVELAIKKL